MAVNDVTVVREVPQSQRKIRSPKHQFHVHMRPYAIQPMMIAPVLPGETMKQMLFQGTARSDALLSDQIGWWFENFYFYVKHRDLAQRDLVTAMHLDPAANVDALRSGTYNRETFAFPGGVDWVKACLDCVTAEYFRDEGEAVMAAAIDGLPQASANVDTWFDSVKLASEAPAHDELLPGEVEQMPDQGIPPGFEAAYAQWQHMRALNLYAATFEDYLKSFGVKPAKELQVNEIHRPELIRYVRDWAYPQVKFDNTIGTAAPQMIWNVTERADKDRFFSEPGFIFGVCVARPKVYWSQGGAATGMLDNAYTWLPAVLDDAPYTSLRKYAGGAGPIGYDISEEYWVDVKDLFMHGDQFLTYQNGVPEDLFNYTVGFPNIRSGKFNRRFTPLTEIARLFKDANHQSIRYEGVVSLQIASRLRDTTL